MKSVLILSCLLGMSLAMRGKHRSDLDAQAPAYTDEVVASPSEDKSLLVTVDSNGRVLKEEPITEDELKQIEEQLTSHKTEPVASEGRRPQDSQLPAPAPQTFHVFSSPFFGPYPYKPNFRAGATAPASQAVAVNANSQTVFPQHAVYVFPAAAFSQYNYRTQPVYILNPVGFEGGYGHQFYPKYNPHRTFSV